MFEQISEVFDVEHVLEDEGKKQVPARIESTEIVPVDPIVAANEDFEFARTKIRDSIEKTSAALDDMLDLARASEHPRAYEVLSGLAGNMTSMSEALVKLHKETLKNQPKQESNTTNQNLILTTDALIAMLKNQKSS